MFVAAVAVIFVPLFFQLDGTLFTDPATLRAARGAVTNLPLPISVLAAAIGLVALSRKWLKDAATLVLFVTVPLMFLTAYVAGDGLVTWTKVKLLLFQFAVPLVGFTIGRQLGNDKSNALQPGYCLLAVTGSFALAELTSSWLRYRSPALSADVYGLNVYGHLQYVPTIIVSAFLVGFFTTWERHCSPRVRTIAIWLVPLVAVYAAASMQFTAILALWFGLGTFAALPHSARTRALTVVLLAASIVLTAGYVRLGLSHAPAYQAKFLGARELPPELDTEYSGEHPASQQKRARYGDEKVGRNVSERLAYWRYFARGSTSDVRAFLFGHASQPDIRKYPSAHNYYLDFLYNFGAIAMVPLLLLMAWSVRWGWNARAALVDSPALAGLVFATIFLLAVDNGMRVSMRQPYPGIATFFLWGVATIRLQASRAGTVASRLRAADEPQQPVTSAVH